MTRVYVPATWGRLAAWYAAGAIPAEAFAEAFEAPDESEEGEYAALMSAAEAAADLAAASGGDARRVVLVVEALAAAPVPFAEVLAVHADAVAPSGPEEDLGWYAVQEIDHLLA